MLGNRDLWPCVAFWYYLTHKLGHTHPSTSTGNVNSLCGHNTTITSTACPDDQLDKRLKYGIAAGVACFVVLLVLWVTFMYYLKKNGYICQKKSPSSSSTSSSSSSESNERSSHDCKMATLDVVSLERDGKALPSGFTNPCYEQDEPITLTPNNCVHNKTSQSPCVT